MKKNNTYKNIIPAFIFFTLLFIIIGLSNKNTSVTSQSGWTLQTNLQSQLRGRTISDMTFTDSVTGYAVTPYVNPNDSAFILKTTNGGDNWFAIISQSSYVGGFKKIKFLNINTGYVCGSSLRKTTNAGQNWITINTNGIFAENMYVLNEDTIFLTNSETLDGGVFRTTNGGQNWEQLYSAGNDNPTDIYMYNARIGFQHGIGFFLYKTTNGGYNWFSIDSGGFYQMYFIDSLIGYRAYQGMKKTTNGGYNWTNQILPNVSNGTNSKNILRFQINRTDTIWGVGSSVQFHNPNRDRGVISKTTNGGLNWGYQLPDTHNIQIPVYNKICLIGDKFIWAYNGLGMGVHTITGGDSTIYTNVCENNLLVSSNYILFQNYPNPFNASTRIKYKVESTKQIKLIVFDILGKEITTLVNQKQKPGEYEITFFGAGLSSGVYYYVLYSDGVMVNAKKMLMLK